MEKTKKGLTSFQTCWIFGSLLSGAGLIIGNGGFICIGLFIIVVGIIAGIFRKGD